ncbi:hypothetical protein EV363DRAFT_43320 [Boletus edulis]|nr:hypothetical protein EV363DRAFT_43320 [Boletus edulis]
MRFSFRTLLFDRPLPNETRGTKYQGDPPPYTSPSGGGWIEVPKQTQPMALSPRENVQFERLAQSKCFALIDDTASMQYSWPQTRAALAGIVDMLSSNEKWDGLNIRFLHHAQTRSCVKTREDFESIFNSVTMWRGQRAMAAKVTQVFEESLRWMHGTSAPRPVVLLIISDGLAIDTQELFNAIACICQKLDEKCIPPHMFRMHMLQMGDNRKAVQPLHDFRDRITQRDRERRILNVVSFHRGRGPLNAQNIFRLLLASTNVPPEEDPDIGERLPPQVMAAQYSALEGIRAMRIR